MRGQLPCTCTIHEHVQVTGLAALAIGWRFGAPHPSPTPDRGGGMQLYFDHERLEVYQVGRELNREIAEIVKELPEGLGESADNLTRAGRSITRNIAEGSSKGTAADRCKFYRIARGSATEVPASLDEMVDGGAVTEARTQKARQLALRIVAMLVNLIRATTRAEDIGTIPPKHERVRGKDVHVHVDRARARQVENDPD
jgi:four helix bundle protein